MSVVEVKIGTRNFNLACEDGEEEHLEHLATQIDAKVSDLSRQMRTGNESLLILMTALMVQDELNEFTKNDNIDLDAFRKEVEDNIKNKKDSETTELINTVSDYLESLVDKIEKNN